MKGLTWYPETRASAQELLSHPWLKMQANYDCKMSDDDYERMMNKIKDDE